MKTILKPLKSLNAARLSIGVLFMKKTEASFLSTNGTDEITYYIYSTENPKAILQISHGMCEYINRYEPFAAFLNANGIIMCGNDHLGHGESARLKGSLGYFANENGWRYLAEDLRKTKELTEAAYPDLPYFLLGHSMGSFVARDYLTKYGTGLAGAIISGTSGGEKLADIGLLMARRIKNSHGEKYRSKFLSGLAFKGYTKKYDDVQSGYDWLSKDRNIINDYAKNPLCNFTFTTSGFIDLFTLLKHVSTLEWAHKVPKALPVYMISGAMDPVGAYGKGVGKVYERLKKAGVKDLELKLYKDGRHEMLNELNKEDVYKDILLWLEKHLI
jgi:alpha-beta hydrolase superfamily lysophospholipase